jgi:hypothetical protein
VNCYGLSPRFAPVSHDHDYWKLFCELWREGKTVVLIEHDVLPWPGAIEELLACPALWCSCSYRINGGYGIHHAFGCTKISADFMQLLPDVWQRIINREWHALDSQLCHAALQAGQVPHPHRPPAIHLK